MLLSESYHDCAPHIPPPFSVVLPLELEANLCSFCSCVSDYTTLPLTQALCLSLFSLSPPKLLLLMLLCAAGAGLMHMHVPPPSPPLFFPWSLCSAWKDTGKLWKSPQYCMFAVGMVVIIYQGNGRILSTKGGPNIIVNDFKP